MDRTAQSVSFSSDNIFETSFGTFSHFENGVHVTFGGGRDQAIGSSGQDNFIGNGGSDTLSGGGGDDWLQGGKSADQLSGGAGRDVFVYRKVVDSTADLPDTILDFRHSDGDQIWLRSLDTDQDLPHKQHFVFIDQQAFTGSDARHAELRQQVNDDGTVTVQGDVNHDGFADFAILVHTAAPLVRSDFEL